MTTMANTTVLIVDIQPPLASAPKSPTIDRLTASANSMEGIL